MSILPYLQSFDIISVQFDQREIHPQCITPSCKLVLIFCLPSSGFNHKALYACPSSAQTTLVKQFYLNTDLSDILAIMRPINSCINFAYGILTKLQRKYCDYFKTLIKHKKMLFITVKERYEIQTSIKYSAIEKNQNMISTLGHWSRFSYWGKFHP